MEGNNSEIFRDNSGTDMQGQGGVKYIELNYLQY